MSKIRSKTPVQKYSVDGNTIYVKREDMQGDSVTYPAWGKLLASRELMRQADKSRPLVALNTYGSFSGWALSSLCRDLDIEFHMVFPRTKLIHDDYLDICRENGAVFHDIRPNMFKIMYGQMGKYAEQNHCQQLAYAYNSPAYLKFAAKRMLSFLENAFDKRGVLFDNVVIPSGSGVTLSGLAAGFFRFNPKGRIYTSSVGTMGGVETQLKRYPFLYEKRSQIHVHKSDYDFNCLMNDVETPFPCNQFWDKKAWHWLTNNINSLSGTTLFWNLGADNEFVPPYRSMKGAKYVLTGV